METGATNQKSQGFIRRHRRFFLVAGGGIGLGVLTIVVVLAVILYKASRVYERPVPDIVPAEAALYVECLELPRHWPDIEAFLETVRDSQAYGKLGSVSAVWKKAGIDRALDGALDGLKQVRERTGIDPLEAGASTETVLAVFQEENTEGETADAEESRPPPFIFYTRLATRLVRIAALFPGQVARQAARGDLQYDSTGPHGRLIFSSGKTPSSVYFSVLDDILILSSRSELIDRSLELAASDIPTGLSSKPAFIQAMESAVPPGPVPARFWVDFDKFDAMTDIRKKSEFKLAKYPFNYAGLILNEMQKSVIDLTACRSLAGWVELSPRGRLDLEGVFLYGEGGGSGLSSSKEFAPTGNFASDMIPAGAMSFVTVQRSFSDFWSGLTSDWGGDGQGPFDRFMDDYGEEVNRLLPELGPDFTVFFHSHPMAAVAGDGPPIPWTGLVIRCRDTIKVTALVRDICEEKLAKLSKNADRLPYLSEPSRIDEVEIIYVEDIPEGVREPIAPDFTPGFATWRDRLILFSSRDYLLDMVEALSSRRSSLATDPVFAALRSEATHRPNFVVHFDGPAMADAVASPRYCMGIAESLTPLDNERWVKINEDIRKRHGNLQPGELKRRQDEAERRILLDRRRKAAEIARNSHILRIFEAMEVSGSYLIGPDESPGGLKVRMTLLFATR
ncbi:MAG: hypothetical protein ACYTFG_05895 [Planctomycetota bacterium]|jgi:hypothetical protein